MSVWILTIQRAKAYLTPRETYQSSQTPNIIVISTVIQESIYTKATKITFK